MIIRHFTEHSDVEVSVQMPQAGVSSLGDETVALILLFLSLVGSLAESSSLCPWQLTLKYLCNELSGHLD